MIGKSLLAAAGVLALALPVGAQPQVGDHHETYSLTEAGGAAMTFRVYTPTRWRQGMVLPLVILLHGYNQPADKTFDHAPPEIPGQVQRLAEQYGFIVAAPVGYDTMGDYGANLPLPNPLPPRPGAPDGLIHASPASALAEADVMHVRAMMLAEYGADSRRVYLMGNSMGMTGVLNLAKTYPGQWCAIGPSDGPPWQDYPVERLRYLSGAIIVNGEKDTIALTAVNRSLADRLRAAGVDTRFIEVSGGTHPTAWYTALPDIFAFFATHDCAAR